MDIKYKIQLHSIWHCGSGESKGADLDALVIKDNNDLPIIPGKTLKGLIKEGMQTIMDYQPGLLAKTDFVQIFGEEGKSAGDCFFKNATLPDNLVEFLASNDGKTLTNLLYKKVSFTAINPENGVAIDHSLRSIEVTVPIELESEILNVPEKLLVQMELTLKMIKNLGTGRNKGLGRCTFITKGGKQ